MNNSISNLFASFSTSTISTAGESTSISSPAAIFSLNFKMVNSRNNFFSYPMGLLQRPRKGFVDWPQRLLRSDFQVCVSLHVKHTRKNHFPLYSGLVKFENIPSQEIIQTWAHILKQMFIKIIKWKCIKEITKKLFIFKISKNCYQWIIEFEFEFDITIMS